jgi:hypothetical protein
MSALSFIYWIFYGTCSYIYYTFAQNFRPALRISNLRSKVVEFRSKWASYTQNTQEFLLLRKTTFVPHTRRSPAAFSHKKHPHPHGIRVLTLSIESKTLLFQAILLVFYRLDPGGSSHGLRHLLNSLRWIP